jgi:protein-S-isoprenylcysteine O-methyltransferase Ste14
VAGDPEIVPGVGVGELVLAWTLMVAATAVAVWAIGSTTALSVRLAAPLLLVGGLLALAAVRALGRGAELVTGGPYRWVRHPYFLGILLMLAGAIIAMRAWPVLVLLLPTVRLTVWRARREEHNLALRFGDRHAQYQARVAFILPLRPPLPKTT